jgi:hypothetical protein
MFRYSEYANLKEYNQACENETLFLAQCNYLSGENGWQAVQSARGAVCISSLGGDCNHTHTRIMHDDS